MFISDFSIRRPLITVVAMVALVVFGIAALMQLETDEFPDIANPVVLTAIPYPGASPEQVEREILDPVEEAIQSISGVDRVMGVASDGYAQIITIFVFEKDLKEATQDIRDGISAIRRDLPSEMEEPLIQRFDPADFPIVQISVTSSTHTPPELTRIADPGVTRELRSIPGVAQVQVLGAVERELTIELKPAALAAARLSIGEVVQALQFQNLAVPVGRLTGTLDERTIRLQGRLERPEDFAQMVVSERNGTIIRLGQVADVRDGTEEPRSLALYNSQQAVGIDIKKTKGYSTTEVSDEIRATIAKLQETLPTGVRLEILRDAGIRVEDSVRSVEEALFVGALLTVLVVFVFLNSWRSTVITGLALPVSVLAAFIAVWALGFKLETMSLLGLSLAIGILIDDAIVVRENIVRHLEMGKDHFTAAREGTDEIGLAVTATTFSIIAVFVPVGFMSGVSGQWFKPFALTIASSVLVSLFVSFSLDPMLSAYWKDPHRLESERMWISRKLAGFNRWFHRQSLNYKRVIAWALDHRLATVVIAAGSLVAAFVLPVKGFSGLAVVVALLIVLVLLLIRPWARWYTSMALIAVFFVAMIGAVAVVPPFGQVGGAFFPEDDTSELTLALETPPGANLDYARLKVDEVLKIVRRHPEVMYTFSTAGNPQSGSVDAGSIYTKLTPKDTRETSAEELAQILRVETANVAGVKVSVFTSTFGGGYKQIQIQLQGPDVDALNTTAAQILEQVKQVPGAVDIGLSSKGLKPELDVEMNRSLAGSLGITVGQIAQSLRPAFAGIDAGDWVDPAGETRDVVVRLSPEARQRVTDLEQLPIVVTGPTGSPTTMPLGQVARITKSTGPAQIDHLNRDRVVYVQANVGGGRSLSEVRAEIDARIGTLQIPSSVSITEGGEVESQQEVFTAIAMALGVAILLMYLILVVQFGSFLDPLAIMISLPLSLIGVMLALALTGNTINLMSLIGVIMLMGLVTKNAILLIDFAKWAREKNGTPLRDALVEAGAIRLRPIVMTTVALVAGMVPVALGRGEGAQFRAPLGIAVIGGVITSTFLTLLVIPTFYEILDDWRSALASRFGFRTKQMTAEHEIGPVPVAGD